MNDEARQAKLRRLHALELQAAQAGYETKPAIALEIEDLRRELGLDSSEPSLMAVANPQLYIPSSARLDGLEKTVDELRRWQFWMAIAMVVFSLTSLFLSILALILVTMVQR